MSIINLADFHNFHQTKTGNYLLTPPTTRTLHEEDVGWLSVSGEIAFDSCSNSADLKAEYGTQKDAKALQVKLN